MQRQWRGHIELYVVGSAPGTGFLLFLHCLRYLMFVVVTQEHFMYFAFFFKPVCHAMRMKSNMVRVHAVCCR